MTVGVGISFKITLNMPSAMDKALCHKRQPSYWDLLKLITIIVLSLLCTKEYIYFQYFDIGMIVLIENV